MSKECIVDFETLSTRPDGVVLSLGIVIADPEEDDIDFDSLIEKGIEIKFDTKSQIALGRHVEQGTLDWWSKQGADAKRVLTPSENDLQLHDISEHIQNYFDEHNFNPKKGLVWARRSHFEWNLFENIFRTLNIEKVIPYYTMRDIPSVIDVNCGTISGKVPGFKPHPHTILHNALHDCCNDFLQLVYALGGDIDEIHINNSV